MKKMRKIFTLLVGILLLSSVSYSQTGNATFTLPALTAAPGTDVSVPVYITGIDTLGSFGLQINWDNSVLHFKSQSFPKLTGNFLFNPLAGSFIVAWSSNPMDAVRFNPSGEIIGTIVFTYLGGTTDIVFDNSEDRNLATNNPPINDPISYNLSFENGSVSPLTTPIDINTQPQSTAVCAGSDVTFTIDATGQTSYLWQVSSNGGTDWSDVSTGSSLVLNAVTASMDGYMYQCILTNSDNSVTSDAATLTVYATPVVIASAVAANLTSTEGFATYQWYYNLGPINGATNNTYTATETGDYYVHVTDAHNCAANSNTVNIQVNPPLAISGNLTATQNPICAGSSTTLGVEVTGGTGTISYLWTPGDGTESTFIVSPAETTTYTVKVTDDLTSVESTIEIIVNPLPVATISHVDPLTFCEGGSVTLTASEGAGYTYQWIHNGDNIANATNITYVAASAGDYQVEVTALGCSRTSSGVNVVVNALPTVNITPSGLQLLPEGESILLTANTEDNIVDWFLEGVSLGVNTTTFDASADGTYTVSVSNGPCTAVSEGVEVLHIIITPPDLVVSANPNPICAGQSSVISADVTNGSSDYTFEWSNGMVDNIFEVTPAQTTTYSVTVTDNLTTLTVTGSVTLTVNEVPVAVIDPVGPVTITEPETVTLHANTGTGYTYQWFNEGSLIVGESSADLVVSQTGNYTVVITSGACVSNPSSVVSVTVNPAPDDFTIFVTAKSAHICQGEQVTLQASTNPFAGNYTWVWSDGTTEINTAMSFNVTPTETTTYYVTVTDTDSHFVHTGDVLVTVDTPPVASVTPAGPKTIVEGQQIELQATQGEGYTYVWYTGATVIQGENNFNLIVTAAGTYHAVVSHGLCSVVTNNVVINTVPPIQVDVTASVNPLCEGESTTINAAVTGGSGDFSYIWSNTFTVSNFNDSPATSTTYDVTVTDNVTSETATGSVHVAVNTIPSANITPSGATEFCQGGSVTLNATTGQDYTYIWLLDGNTIQNATNETYVATASGAYKVMITHLGCSATSTEVAVTVNALPNATLNYTGTQIVYVPNTITLTAPEGYSYKWFKDGVEINGEVTNTYTTGEAGVYYVEVTSNGCTSTSLAVTVETVLPNVCDVNVPTGLNVISKTTSSVTLGWNKVNPAADSAFIVRIYQAGTKNYIYKVLRNGETTGTKGTLSICTDYNADIRTRCTSYPDGKLHKSAYSAPVAFKTLCESDVCPIPANLQSSNVTNTTAQVSWTIGTNVNATRYTVRYIGNQPGMTYHFRQTTNPGMLLQWLSPGTNYTWDVKVFCDGLGTKRFYVNQGHFTTTGVYGGKVASTTVSKDVDFYVYPNPSNGIFTVSVNGLENNVNLTVMNLQGQVVYNKDYANSFTEDVDLSGLAKGVYFIKLMNDNTNQVRKIVIQ